MKAARVLKSLAPLDKVGVVLQDEFHGQRIGPGGAVVCMLGCERETGSLDPNFLILGHTGEGIGLLISRALSLVLLPETRVSGLRKGVKQRRDCVVRGDIHKYGGRPTGLDVRLSAVHFRLGSSLLE